MRILFITIVGFAILGLTLFTCSRQAMPHSNERTAIYNLSTMIRLYGRQLDRIEDRLSVCERFKEKR